MDMELTSDEIRKLLKRSAKHTFRTEDVDRVIQFANMMKTALILEEQERNPKVHVA